MADRTEQLEILYEEISDQLAEFIFEKNTEQLRQSVGRKVDAFLENYGLYSYTVICEDSEEALASGNLGLYAEVQFAVGESHYHVHASISPVDFDQVVDE